jgi:hypothetical protein
LVGAAFAAERQGRYPVCEISMMGIRISIVRWVADDQPGWVECSFLDDAGSEHRVREKAPVVSSADLHAGSRYPQPGIIGCTVLRRHRAADGHEVVTVETEQPWGIESVEGRSQFEVRAESLVEFPHE